MRSRTGHHQRGATLVEFAFVALLLFLLIFGIIGFGVVLSFKQTVTQAANEAARAAAVTQDDTVLTPGTDERLVAADTSITSFEAWGRDCSDPAMDCQTDIHDCGFAVTVNVPATKPDCITVRLTYDYGASPIIPNVPLIGAFMPDEIETTATAQLSFPNG